MKNILLIIAGVLIIGGFVYATETAVPAYQLAETYLLKSASTTIEKLASLATVGTITSGTWNGTAIVDAYVADTITASNYLTLSASTSIAKLPSLSTIGAGTGFLYTTSGALSASGTVDSAYIEDAYIKNTGDTGTGDYTFSNAYFTMASTSSLYINGRREPELKEKCFTVASTTFATFDNIPLWLPSRAVTVASTSCYTVGTGGTDDEVVAVLNDTSDDLDSQRCTNTRTNDQSLSNNQWSATSTVQIDFTAASTTASYLNFCLYFTYD